MFMRWYKVKALMVRDFLILRRSKWRFLQLFYFPLTTIIIWGLFALFSKAFALEAGLIVLAINIFWSFSLQSQSGINNMVNEDVWSGSLKQVLTTGISESEYVFARILTSMITSFAILLAMILMSVYWFGLTIITANIPLTLLFTTSTLIASVGLAIVITACFVYLGREYSFLAWTALQMFILLSAPFYPVDIFPEPFKTIAYGMPFTGLFSGIRELITTSTVSNSIIALSLDVPI